MSYARFDDDCRWYIFGSRFAGTNDPAFVICDEDREVFYLDPNDVREALRSGEWRMLGRELNGSDLEVLTSASRAWLADLSPG